MHIGRGSVSAEFNLWNPLYALAPLVLLSISIPLAIFAVFTTSIAISLLFCRAAVVYVQLTAALIGSWIESPASKPVPTRRRSPSTASPERTSPHRYRSHRRSITGSTSSLETDVPAAREGRLPNNSASFATLLGTSEIPRDFEGVGGWRAPGDDDEEALWMGMNSRLQLPADATPRRHQRSLTGGTSPSQRWSWSPEILRMSPAQSRARTPVSFAVGDGEDYFLAQPMTSARPLSSASEPTKRHKRRKSGSGSSNSSKASAIAMTGKDVGG